MDLYGDNPSMGGYIEIIHLWVYSSIYITQSRGLFSMMPLPSSSSHTSYAFSQLTERSKEPFFGFVLNSSVDQHLQRF